jgi:hypothetical protein
MPRPGGNPVLKEHQFSCDGEPNTERLSLWIKPSVMEKLKALGKEKNNFIRSSIEKALKEIEDQ